MQRQAHYPRSGAVERLPEGPSEDFQRWEGPDPLVVSHERYRALGGSEAERQQAYVSLFRAPGAGPTRAASGEPGRIVFQGFSVLPPQGRGWLIVF